MKISSALGITIALSVVSAIAMGAEKSQVPKGYEKWEKSKQKMITDKNSLFYGSHYIYVDKKAMPAYRSGTTFPEGSRLVVVNYSLKDEGGQLVQGKKSMIVLMEKNKKFKETGGWRFAGFTPEGKPSGLDPVKNCYECHLKEAKDRDLVISRFSDFK